MDRIIGGVQTILFIYYLKPEGHIKRFPQLPRNPSIVFVIHFYFNEIFYVLSFTYLLKLLKTAVI